MLYSGSQLALDFYNKMGVLLKVDDKKECGKSCRTKKGEIAAIAKKSRGIIRGLCNAAGYDSEDTAALLEESGLSKLIDES